MPNKRSYEDGCAAAHALDLIGERWALLIVRELLLGPKRFTDLRTSLPGISLNVLTQRLSELEQGAVVRKRKLGPPVGTWVYDLTEWGRELEPVIIQLGRWGARSPLLPLGAPLSVNSIILSFRAMFSPLRAHGLKASYEIRLGEEHFHAEVADGRIEIDRGSARKPDVILETDVPTLAELVYGGHAMEAARKEGRLKYQGDKALLLRFLTLFTLPTPAMAE